MGSERFGNADKRPGRLLRAVLLLICCGLSNPLLAWPVAPFTTFNQSPLVQIFGLPPIGEARILPSGEERFRLLSMVASNYVQRSNASESLLLDGETQRVELDYVRSKGGRFEWGLHVPYITHSPGALDSFIIKWHDIFGLPQGGRDTAPRDVLNYNYQRNGVTLLSQTIQEKGVGDVRLSGGWRLMSPGGAGDSALALRASLKLPTGDSASLQGSGGTDLAVWLSGAHGGFAPNSWFSIYGGLGMAYLGPGDVLPDQQRSSAVFGSLGAGAWFWHRVSLKAQVDFHTALYQDTDLRPLGDDAVQLAVGGDLRLIKNTRIELAVIEDVAVTTAPDVVFYLGITVED